MQIIGIYLENGDDRIIKNLQKNQWYPFGKFENCHDIISNTLVKDVVKFKKLQSALVEIKEFNKKLYSLTDYSSGKNDIPININCIVGKNGSGKTSLLNIIYRIINNLSCEIKSKLKKYNADYHPVWAAGFNAELYYEMNDSIFCISVSNNEQYRIIDEKEDYKQQVKLDDSDKIRSIKLLKVVNNKSEDIITDKIEKLRKDNTEIDEPFLEFIGQNVFYTVGTNYSLYSNSVITDEWDDNEEKWLGNIYHKNDGYFTPVVLVPYKSEWTTINTKKELSLAKERISTIALLIYSQTGEDFIENLIPDSINYEMIEKKVYKDKEYSFSQYMHQKTVNTIDEYYENLKKANPLDVYNKKNIIAKDKSLLEEVEDAIMSIWRNKYFKEERTQEQKQDEEQEVNKKMLDRIKEKTLAYLTYKTIKICLYYDVYKNVFPEEFDKDILITFKKAQDKCIEKINNIIDNLFTKQFPLNFTNLKIKQCITFLDNLTIYLKDETHSISAYKFKEEILKNMSVEDLRYDYIFENLPPAYFNKQIYFRKKNETADSSENKKVTISSMSSGESQLLNSMSYAVYHIKNAISSKIKYNNINLIFDEAELYYHPEYQRVFIKDLLGIIGRSNLEGVKGINITIVTHSPFILSDIPSDNLLCLKDGIADNDGLSKTLGANFYDLLKNQFFMESSIGSVTEKIVNKIIDDFNIIIDDKLSVDLKNKTRKEYANVPHGKINFYETFVYKLSDQYLRMTLKNMIGIIKEESFVDRRIKELNEKISELKGNNNA